MYNKCGRSSYKFETLVTLCYCLPMDCPIRFYPCKQERLRIHIEAYWEASLILGRERGGAGPQSTWSGGWNRSLAPGCLGRSPTYLARGGRGGGGGLLWADTYENITFPSPIYVVGNKWPLFEIVEGNLWTNYDVTCEQFYLLCGFKPFHCWGQRNPWSHWLCYSFTFQWLGCHLIV